MKTGVAFGDYISSGKASKRKYHDDLDDGSTMMRGFLIPVFVAVAAGILLFRLLALQLIYGVYYRGLSDTNRTRTKVIHAPRGIIFDRNGIPLVYNTPGFRHIDKDHKVKLLSREKALAMIAQGEKNLEVDALREYPFKEAFGHVLGYVGQISEDELKQGEFLSYKSGDLIGEMGIERYYEHALSGTDGKTLIEVDSSGKEMRTLGQTDPKPGNNITLTLDAKLQDLAFQSVKEVKKGAVIVSNPKGEILALVSKPSFDPNLFTLDETYKTATDASYISLANILSDHTSQPLLNRAITGTYPPGSTFKLVTAASGLEGRIDENYTVDDNGTLRIGEFSFANWYFTQYGKTEGKINIVGALKRSNDIFFYKLAQTVGVDWLSQTAEKFGVGTRLGIDIPGEAKGLLPTKKWKEETIGEKWYLGDTYHYGIGQGYLLATPLQVNSWTQAIVNKGKLYIPHLFKNQDLRVKQNEFLGDKTVALLREGMVASCSPGGVAWPLFEFRVKNSELRKKIDNKNYLVPKESTTSAQLNDWVHIPVACKTGTAQHGGEKTEPHAWITLFAPIQKPEIVVTVLVESSGEGSNVAAPVAKKVLEEWFGR